MSELELLDRSLASSALASDVFFSGEPCGDWRMNTSGSGHAAFHLVLRGSPWLHFPHNVELRRQLRSGDFVFFPRDTPHVLTASADAPPDIETVLGEVRPIGATDDQIALLCGKLVLEPYAQRFLLAPLPDIVVMPAGSEEAPRIVPSIVSIMWDEVRGHERPLSVTLNKLADVLVVQVLRFAVRQGLVTSGVFAALADPQLRRAVLDLVRAPEQAWSVELLAQKALMSRSAFASRFQSVVGRTPLDFLRDWRMHLAVGLLRSGRSVAEVAAATGYDTEASFAKAFKRMVGIGPGAVRAR
ncbi:MAG: AraC family transcriptional regulator [Dehalococcoidia bacterium]